MKNALRRKSGGTKRRAYAAPKLVKRGSLRNITAQGTRRPA